MARPILLGDRELEALVDRSAHGSRQGQQPADLVAVGRIGDPRPCGRWLRETGRQEPGVVGGAEQDRERIAPQAAALELDREIEMAPLEIG